VTPITKPGGSGLLLEGFGDLRPLDPDAEEAQEEDDALDDPVFLGLLITINFDLHKIDPPEEQIIRPGHNEKKPHDNHAGIMPLPERVVKGWE
jgi:hypothetical protein